jgi:hypothetical protein
LLINEIGLSLLFWGSAGPSSTRCMVLFSGRVSL